MGAQSSHLKRTGSLKLEISLIQSLFFRHDKQAKEFQPVEVRGKRDRATLGRDTQGSARLGQLIGPSYVCDAATQLQSHLALRRWSWLERLQLRLPKDDDVQLTGRSSAGFNVCIINRGNVFGMCGLN